MSENPSFLAQFEQQQVENDHAVFELSGVLENTSLPRWTDLELEEFEAASMHRIDIKPYREYMQHLPRLDLDLLMEVLFEKIRNKWPVNCTLTEFTDEFTENVPKEKTESVREAPGWLLFVAKVAANFGVNYGYCRTISEIYTEMNNPSKKLY